MNITSLVIIVISLAISVVIVISNTKAGKTTTAADFISVGSMIVAFVSTLFAKLKVPSYIVGSKSGKLTVSHLHSLDEDEASLEDVVNIDTLPKDE